MKSEELGLGAGSLTPAIHRWETRTVRVTLLGPVSAEADGVAIALGGPKQRAVFALLALNAGRVVSMDRLVDELWSDLPPSRATMTLQSYVSRLRRVLSNVAETSPGVPHVLPRPPGWILTLPPEEVDAIQFNSLVDQARLLIADGTRAGLVEAKTVLRDASQM